MRWARCLLVGLVCLMAGTVEASDGSQDLQAFSDAVPPCAENTEHCFGLVLHIVHTDEGSVQSPEWVAEQVAEANRLFAEIGVGFELAEVKPVSSDDETVVTRTQRDELGREDFSKGVVHVYVVGHLMNVDDEGEIYGVHWRDREKRSRRWVILSSISWSRTLAHELGHFFGLKHSTFDISIMNKTRRASPPVAERAFADEEFATMKKRTRRMLKKGLLVPVVRDSGSP